MRKNIAGQKWRVFAWNVTTGVAETGLTDITAKIQKDFGAAVATDDTNPTEFEDGFYDFTLTQAETNAADLHISPESATSDIAVVGVPAHLVTAPEVLVVGPLKTGGGRFQVDAYLESSGVIVDVSAISVSITEVETDGTGTVLYADGAISRQKQVDNSWMIFINGATSIVPEKNYRLDITFDPAGTPVARRAALPFP